VKRSTLIVLTFAVLALTCERMAKAGMVTNGNVIAPYVPAVSANTSPRIRSFDQAPLAMEVFAAGTTVENQGDKGDTNFAGSILNASEPTSLALLGAALLSIAGIGRRFQNSTPQRSRIRLKAAWQVVTSFFL
jgi:hypothetical protein